MAGNNHTRLGLMAMIGIALFVLIQFAVPSFSGQENTEQWGDVLPSVSADSAAETARQFVSAKTARPVKTLVTFQTDRLLGGYLQKNGLVQPYQQQFNHTYPVDFYRVEITTAQPDGFYYVDVHMQSGKVIGWRQKPEDTFAGNAAQNRAAAERYLETALPDAGQFQLVRASSGRDASVVFRHRTAAIGEAKLMVAVYVRHGEVIGHQASFAVPESYIRWQTQQDTAADRMSLVSFIASLLLTVAAVTLAVVRRKVTFFQRGVLFTCLFLLLYFINNINMYPAFRVSMGLFPDDWHVAFAILFTCAVTVLLAVELYFSFIVGEQLMRGHGLSLWPSWREPDFGRHVFRSMQRGYLLCLFILGVQSVLLYIAEQGFDSWAVNDPSMSMYNFLVPGLFPLMAWVAGISEEAVYRLFGIMVFKKLVRNTFLAVLIPSMLWALSHTTYPVYPVYTRFVEVTVLGLIFGYAFLKYGFYTAMFAHVAMDSILMGLSYMFSIGSLTSLFVGLLHMASPAIVAYIIRWLHNKKRGRTILPSPAESQ